MKTILKIILLVLFFSGCNEEKRYLLNKKYQDIYTQYYWDRFKYETKYNFDLSMITKFKSIMEEEVDSSIPLFQENYDYPFFDDHTALKIDLKYVGSEQTYSFYKHITNNFNEGCSVLQIEYPNDSSLRSKTMILSSICDYPNQPTQSFYINWTSIASNTFQYLDVAVEKSGNIYMWGINKSTDTIFTNFSEKGIATLFPEFDGKYIFKKFSRITANYEYEILSDSFISNIDFND